MMPDQDIVWLALHIAALRDIAPDIADRLEQFLYTEIAYKLPESEQRYILELTEPRIYQ